MATGPGTFLLAWPRRVVPVTVAVLAGTLASCAGDEPDQPGSVGTPSESPQPSTRTATPDPTESAATVGRSAPQVVRTVARGLQAPWGLTFLPDGTALVGERDTTRVLAVEGNEVREVGVVEEARPAGEAGLLGLAASPTYDRDRLVYAYVSTASDNRVVRFTYDGGRIGAVEPVLTGIPNGFIHDGGRLLAADDGMLLVSTGETGEPGLAQDPASLGGKILRITLDGRAAPDNPDPDSPVWTLGHRNVQGLAYDARGRLWATEFGQSTWDELNLIEPSRNYGWPFVEGRGEDDRFRDPFVTWRTEDASPSGLAFARGSLWAGALNGERLWEVPVTASGTGKPRGWFVGDYGRLRTVVRAPDGNLWVTTSNRDGRGAPAPEDDRILEIAVP
jgi:glucose/arabinose dehydrogenase